MGTFLSATSGGGFGFVFSRKSFTNAAQGLLEKQPSSDSSSSPSTPLCLRWSLGWWFLSGIRPRTPLPWRFGDPRPGRLKTRRLQDTRSLTPLPELLAAHAEERPVGAFSAVHAGRLVGDRVERKGPVKVTAVLGRTAVVMVEREFRTARLADLAVDPECLSWRSAGDYDLRLMDSRNRGRRSLVLRRRRVPATEGSKADGAT